MSTKGEDKNTAQWDRVESEFPGIPAEAHWSLQDARQNARINRMAFVVPVFVELVEGQSVADLISFLANASDQYSLADHVMDRLATEAEARRDSGPLQFILLSEPDSVESPFWRVLAVGSPQTRVYRPGGFTRGRTIAVKSGPLSRTPVMGIIDDSIGFLNHRFRHDDGTSRFERLWIMHGGMLAGDPGLVTGPPVLFGIELMKGDIDGRIASGRSEQALYREVNSGIFGPAVRHGTAFHAGHGSHVLDLATGADKGDPMTAVPLLGVQLSPASIGETSGAELDPDVVRGLDWIITRALQMPGRFPLVINLSLGSLAGPQDGTSLVERWIAHEIARYHHFSGKAPIRIVIAYGNAWRARLVAEARLGKGESMTIDWRIQPDDTTKSVLELRTRKAGGGVIDLRVTPPDGGPALDRPLIRGSGLIDQYVTARGVAAEAIDAPEPGADRALVTVAPTQRFDTRPAAPSGNWQITLTNSGNAARRVLLKVQRDDTPGGYRRTGRQSWLDHPGSAEYETATRAYSLPGPDSPITRKGSEVSYAGFQHPSVYFIGTARRDPLASNAVDYDTNLLASHYASEGALPKPETATLSALVDRGNMLRGTRAAGNQSGSSSRMSGSSMAAPQITRALLKLALAQQLVATPGLGVPHDPAELQLVLGKPPMPVADAQLGKGTVVA